MNLIDKLRQVEQAALKEEMAEYRYKNCLKILMCSILFNPLYDLILLFTQAEKDGYNFSYLVYFIPLVLSYFFYNSSNMKKLLFLNACIVMTFPLFLYFSGHQDFFPSLTLPYLGILLCVQDSKKHLVMFSLVQILSVIGLYLISDIPIIKGLNHLFILSAITLFLFVINKSKASPVCEIASKSDV